MSPRCPMPLHLKTTQLNCTSRLRFLRLDGDVWGKKSKKCPYMRYIPGLELVFMVSSTCVIWKKMVLASHSKTGYTHKAVQSERATIPNPVDEFTTESHSRGLRSKHALHLCQRQLLDELPRRVSPPLGCSDIEALL